MDDGALVDGLLAHDPVAWAEFDRAFKAKLMAMFTRKGVATQDRPDCYNHLFVHLVEHDGRRLRQWRGDSTLLTWLLTVARNHAVDWVQQVARYQQQHVELGHDGSFDEQADPAFTAEADDPETAATAHELIVQLRRALEALTPRERRVAALHFLDDCAPGAIAAQLGLTTNNVYQVIHRVKQKLGELMNPAANRPSGGGAT